MVNLIRARGISIKGRPVASTAREWWAGLSPEERASVLMEYNGCDDLGDGLYRMVFRSYGIMDDCQRYVCECCWEDARQG